MQIFGFGKKQTDKESQQSTKSQSNSGIKDIKHEVQRWLQLASRFQTTIIALTVALLLAFTALRMLRYMDPPVNDEQVQQNLSKFKQVRIDQKTVQRIKQLQDSGASTSPEIDNGRTNPFAE